MKKGARFYYGLLISAACIGCADKGKMQDYKPAVQTITIEQPREERKDPALQPSIPIVYNVQEPCMQAAPRIMKGPNKCEETFEHYDRAHDEKIIMTYAILNTGVERVRVDVHHDNNTFGIEKSLDGIVDLIKVEPRIGEPILIKGCADKPLVQSGKNKLSEQEIHDLFIDAEKKIDFYIGFFDPYLRIAQRDLRAQFEDVQREENAALDGTLKLAK